MLVSKAKGSTANGGGGKKAECDAAGGESRVLQCLGISSERLAANNAAPGTLGFCGLSYGGCIDSWTPVLNFNI